MFMIWRAKLPVYIKKTQVRQWQFDCLTGQLLLEYSAKLKLQWWRRVPKCQSFLLFKFPFIRRQWVFTGWYPRPHLESKNSWQSMHGKSTPRKKGSESQLLPLEDRDAVHVHTVYRHWPRLFSQYGFWLWLWTILNSWVFWCKLIPWFNPVSSGLARYTQL